MEESASDHFVLIPQSSKEEGEGLSWSSITLSNDASESNLF